MNALYPEIAVDREAVIETIHGLQVDLTLLAAWLARDPEPAMHQAAVIALADARWRLERLTPSVRRH
jgi:hypothetical protein